MEPVKFSMREGCHWHLSEILRVEKEFGNEAKDEKIIEFLDDDTRFYEQLEDFLDLVFEQKCAASMAVFQYLCAKHCICYTKVPAYMHYMPKTYEGYDDLNNDCAEHYYLSEDTKNKLSAAEQLEAENCVLAKQIATQSEQFIRLADIMIKDKEKGTDSANDEPLDVNGDGLLDSKQ